MGLPRERLHVALIATSKAPCRFDSFSFHVPNPMAKGRVRPIGTLLGMVRVNWQGDMVFEASLPSGIVFAMDSDTEHGGAGMGPTPVEALLAATAACSGMDVVSILEKK